MEHWRKFFQSSGVELWTICERALTVAYIDNPEEFPARRDHLAQKLFAPEKLDSHACGLDAPRLEAGGVVEVSCKGEVGSAEECRHTSSGTYDEVEALTEELEEEILLKRDVLSIKELFLDPDQSEREIFNSLQRLELMQLSFDVLKDTEIGKVVNSLRKQSSTRVTALARRLVRGWKDLVQACCKSAIDVAAAAAASGTPASGSLDVDDEEHGLPSPPMDEAALLAPTTSVEMSQLWDLMDDVTSAGSGYPDPLEDESQYSRVPDSREPSERYSSANHAHATSKQSEHRNSAARGMSTREEEPGTSKILKEPRTSASINGQGEKERERGLKNGCNVAHRRLDNEHVERKVHNQSLEKRSEGGSNQRMQTLKPCVNSALSDDKIQVAKRMLRENYEREENAKKQRTIQVLDLHDLPKGGPSRLKNSHLVHGKSSSQIRPRAMSCR